MIPSFEEFLFPVLFALQNGNPLKREELKEACVKYMGLSSEDLQEKISSGKRYKIVDRLQWATYYLLKSGLLCRPNPATEMITNEGLNLVQSGVTKINRQFLRAHYETFREFEYQTREAAKLRSKNKKNTKKKKKMEKKGYNTDLFQQDTTPIPNNIKLEESKDYTPVKFGMTAFEESLNKILEQFEILNDGLVTELINIINDFDTESFRCLLLELFPHMGYASLFEERNLNAKIGHDVKLSGLLNIDELGMNRFFVLAHNKTTEEISLSDVQAFIGALSNIGITSGVYITTSKFSSDALAYQNQGAVRCVLVDGQKLAKLMIKFNIGVVTRKTFEVKEVDQEYLFTRLTR